MFAPTPRGAPTRTASVCASPARSRLVAVRGARCPIGTTELTGVVGVNVFDALWCTSDGMRSPCNHADVRASLRFLAASGLHFFRFFASLYGASHVYWLLQPSRYWAEFDRLMDDVEALGLHVVPSIGAESWHDVANKWINASHNGNSSSAMARVRSPRRAETVNDLVTDGSSLARALARRYADELVRRYRHRPSVLFWELGNELNLKPNMANQCGLGAAGDRGPAARCFNTSALVEYTRDLAGVVRSADKVRPISSGFGATRPTAWHQERCHREKRAGACAAGGESATDSIEQWQQMVVWQNEAVDIASLHVYAGSKGCWFGRGRTGCYRQGNVSLVEAAAAAAASVGKPLYVGEFGGAPPNFTGPSAEHQAFPEAVLRWQVATSAERRRRDPVPNAVPRTLTSLWGWMCPAKRATMRCIWPNASSPLGGPRSRGWHAGEEGSDRMLGLLQWANRRLGG